MSLTLQGICNRDRKFIDVFTGIPGKIHDARTFRLSFIYERIQEICENGYFHLLGDAAYPLSNFLMKTYNTQNLTPAAKNFNKKLCQTRVLVENTFGLLKSRFRQLAHIDLHTVDKCTKLIISCCVLHNLCIDNNDYIDIDDDSQSDNDNSADNDDCDNYGHTKRNELRDKLWTSQ